MQVSGQCSSALFLLLHIWMCCEESTDNKSCEIPAQISCNIGIISEEEQLFSWLGTVIKVQNKELSIRRKASYLTERCKNCSYV